MPRLETFGSTLRSLIRLRFASQRAFAEAVGLTPARVSQIVHAEAESLGFHVLREILLAFPSSDDQDELYEAWRRTHAPPPRSRGEAEPFLERDVPALLAESEAALLIGRTHETIARLHGAYRALRGTADPGLTWRIGIALVEAHYHVGRRALGLRLVDEIAASCRANGDPIASAQAIRLRALGLRPLAGRSSETAAALRDLSDLVYSHASSRPDWRDLRRSLVRDRALFAWQVLGSRPGEVEFARRSVEDLARDLADARSGTERALALEIWTRVAVEMGELDRAEAMLTESERLNRASPAVGSDLKLALAWASLRARQDRREEAESLLIGALDAAGRLNAVHHHARAESLLLRLIDRRA